MTNAIWATRPFHTSAFRFIPKGPRPSLKFHWRSESAVVEVVGAMGDVAMRLIGVNLLHDWEEIVLTE